MIIIWFSQSLSPSIVHSFYNWAVFFAIHVPLHSIILSLLMKIWVYSYFVLEEALNISLSLYPSSHSLSSYVTHLFLYYILRNITAMSYMFGLWRNWNIDMQSEYTPLHLYLWVFLNMWIILLQSAFRFFFQKFA